MFSRGANVSGKSGAFNLPDDISLMGAPQLQWWFDRTSKEGEHKIGTGPAPHD